MPLVPTDLLYDFAAEAAPVARAFVAEQAPKAAVVAQARGFALAHQMAGGAATVSALVGAAIMGAYRSRFNTPNSRGMRGNFTHTRVKPRPVDKVPKRLALREPGHVSSTKTANKKKSRADVAATGLEVVERPLRLQKTLKGDKPKSVWSSLRDMVTGKKVLKNTFSFKMTSERDKRGLMSIPLRHDANLGFNDGNWTVGAQDATLVPAADGYNEYTTMLKTPQQIHYTNRPEPSTSNVIVPRLNLPTLEQTSWDLNNMKIFPGDNLTHTIDYDGTNNNFKNMVTPVLQLGGNAVPHSYGTTGISPNTLPNGYPSASTSYPRKQSVAAEMADPNLKTLYSMPRFKTQLGGGSLKMRLCNQGTNSCTVEFVVVKVANPYVATYDPSGSGSAQITTGGSRCNLTRTWANLYDTVGWEHQKKVQSNLSYAMGTQPLDLEALQLEPLVNPYKPFLPDSCFKAHYDNTNQYDSVTYTKAGGLSTDIMPAYIPPTVNPLAPANSSITNTAIPFDKTGGAGQKTPYRVVNRGHCTIAGAAERNVTIPLPGSNYDASKIQSIAQTLDPIHAEVDGAAPALMSDESYIVLMSVNGSLQDIIEPQLEGVAPNQTSTGNVKVIGKAYTASIIDCYCQYTETVYPSHCDYSDIGPVAYNLGTARTEMLKSSLEAYPGKIMPMADAVPVTQAGVLRTGAKDRAGDNAGSLD